MKKINSFKYIKDKVYSFVYRNRTKPKNLEEARTNLLNYIVREKTVQRASLRGRLDTQSSSEETTKIINLWEKNKKYKQ